MSLFGYAWHEQQAHPPQGVYRLADGALVCTLCFACTISDTAVLAGRRHYVLR